MIVGLVVVVVSGYETVYEAVYGMMYRCLEK